MLHRLTVRDLFELYRSADQTQSAILVSNGWKHLETLKKLSAIVSEDETVMKYFENPQKPFI